MWCTPIPIFRFQSQWIATGGLLAALCFPSFAHGKDEYAAARREMVREIELMAASTPLETGSGTIDRQVLEVMGRVQRHLFVPSALQRHGYENRPLPIGNGQTISQPYIVALMTDLLRPRPGHVVLEIGTGSGYQAAVLAELTRKVHTMEIIEPLGIQAKKRLAQLGYRNVEVEVADGYYGWPSQAPFDGIIVTAAASHVPVPLVQQLKPGGRMVIPVGTSFLTQQLMLIEKRPDGSLVSRQMLPVRFVPLTGRH
ncbi:MAG: protein-L-isoaspartate(D-aspartate) O-methyltransferase [Betaproteobacteria bacterium]